MTMTPQFATLLVLFLLPSALLADDWPQWLGPARDGVWRESEIAHDFPAEGPPVSWRAAIAGGYSGPALAAGRVFVTDYRVASGDLTPDPDARSSVQGTERMLCLDANTGETIWQHGYPRAYEISYPAGPRATPTVDENRVYMLGAEGDLLCLDVRDGTVIWSRHLQEDYHVKAPMWGYAGHPLVLGDQLICLVGGADSAVVAFDKLTGQERWRALATPETGIGYAPPTLIHAAGKPQLLIWHSQSLNSLDPQTGRLYWTEALAPDYGMSIAPPQQLGQMLFVGAIKDKSMGIRLGDQQPSAEVVWRGDTDLGIGPSHCPVAVDPNSDRYLYGMNRDGQLTCIEMSTGKRIWEDFSLMQSRRRTSPGTAFITRHEDVFFILSETAELIIAKLSPEGFQQIARSQPLLEPTHVAFGRAVLWSPPAFAEGSMFVRNDKEVIRVSLRR